MDNKKLLEIGHALFVQLGRHATKDGRIVAALLNRIKELEAAQQSGQVCSYCGTTNGKHELDCWVAHNELAETARHQKG